MWKILETCSCFLVVAVLSGLGKAQPESFSGSAVTDDSTSGANKRGWSMLRLGRGLQMLRLGKRGGNLDALRSGHQVPMLRAGRGSPDTSGRLDANELYAVLSAILDEPRDQSRRQPPLPRYGRDNNGVARDLLDALASDGESSSNFDLLSSLNNGPSYFRPAPRGGRYKRSLPDAGPADYPSLEDYLVQSRQFARPYSSRAVALPRIGRFSGSPRLQAKAVPRPRIGRQESQMREAKSVE